MPATASSQAGRVAAMLETQQLGKLMGAGLLTVGEVFYAMPASETLAYNRIVADVAAARRFVTIQAAINAAQADRNDYVMVGQSTYTLAADVTVNKARLHLIGLATVGRLPLLSCTADFNLVVTKEGVELAGIDIAGSGTTNKYCLEINVSALAIGAMVVRDCTIRSGATSAGICEVRLVDFTAIPRVLFKNCILGQAGTAHPDNVVLQEAGAGGATALLIFEDCQFHHKAAAAGDQFVTLVTASGQCFFRRCLFNNNSSTAMTLGVVSIDARQAMFDNCAAFGCTGLVTTSKGLVAPGGIGNAVTAANVFNPALAVDGAATVAVDT